MAPEYSVNICNLLWLSGRLMISASTKQTRVHISTFPNVLTSKKAKYKYIFFDKLDRSPVSRNLHKPEIQTALDANCKQI